MHERAWTLVFNDSLHVRARGLLIRYFVCPGPQTTKDAKDVGTVLLPVKGPE